jgi:membrane-bound metal-dependent hydrolase YbcI (DUF457 family)
MANFQTHLTASTILGAGYGGAAYGMYGVPPAASLLAGSLCAVSGMLPDIDSGPGRPLREITTLMAAVVPTMLFSRLEHFGLSQEWIILIGAAIYVGIRFGLAAFLRHYTVHRGMYHSFPAAAIFGELTFLLIYSENVVLRTFIAGGVVAGFLSHLLLDEIYSVQWDGRPRLKKSFGTAMKFYGDKWWPNVSAYAKLALLTLVVFKDPGLVEQLQNGQADQVVEELRSDLPTAWNASSPSPGGPADAQAGSLPKPVAPPPGAAGLSSSAGPTAGQANSSTAWPAASSFFAPPPASPPGR